jgi:carbon monoxide dehydrogenase subunit G
MPSREARFTVNAPPQELWKFIRDFHSLCTCIPGIERIEVRDANAAELRVKEKVGVVPLVVDLRAEIDSEEPPRRLHATAKGEHVTLAIDVSLSATAEGTELVSRFDVRGEGPLKPVVDRLFERRATERTAQFAACLERHFGRASPPARPRPWWQRLFRRRASSPPSS